MFPEWTWAIPTVILAGAMMQGFIGALYPYNGRPAHDEFIKKTLSTTGELENGIKRRKGDGRWAQVTLSFRRNPGSPAATRLGASNGEDFVEPSNVVGEGMATAIFPALTKVGDDGGDTK